MPLCVDREVQSRFEEFRKGRTQDRVFRAPSPHPSAPTGFCPCDGSFPSRSLFYLKAAFLEFLMKLPYDRPKIWYLRRLGARVGNGVKIAAGAWIDPTFTDLLVIEDEVMIGLGARIALHAFGPDEFRAGRTVLRRRSVIGGFSILAPGVEVGEGALVAGGAVVVRDVPAGTTAIGNPARVVQRVPCRP